MKVENSEKLCLGRFLPAISLNQVANVVYYVTVHNIVDG